MEFTQFGWNVLTLGFLGTTLFTGICTWVLWAQNKAMWTSRSGESMSVIWFPYALASYIVGLIYGIDSYSIALILNGLLLGLMHIPILWGLRKFKGFSKLEKILSLSYVIIIIIMIFTPFKDWFFLVFISGCIVFSLGQPFEMWRQNGIGVIKIQLLIVYALNSTFWLVYSYQINSWALQAINPPYLAVNIFNVIVWWHYYGQAKKKLQEKK
ncbi:MAG: hypothetical protein V1765_00155 [bacterium]